MSENKTFLDIRTDLFVRIDDFSPALFTLLFGGESVSCEVSLYIEEIEKLSIFLINWLQKKNKHLETLK